MAQALKNKSQKPPAKKALKNKRVAIKNNNPMATVLVANQHSGLIVIPRIVKSHPSTMQRTPLKSINLKPGVVTRLDKKTWDDIKATNKMVVQYIDQGLIIEVKHEKSVIASGVETTDPEPPENLLTTDEIGSREIRLEREEVGQIVLPASV